MGNEGLAAPVDHAEQKSTVLGLSPVCAGCCGCATLFGVVVLGFVIYVVSIIAGLESDEPMAIEKVSYEQADAEALERRLGAYVLNVDRGQGGKLVLSEREMNIFAYQLMAEAREEHPEAEDRIQGFRLTVKPDDKVNIKVCARKTKPDGVAYINVDFNGHLGIDDGKLGLDVDSLTVGTSSLPRFLTDWVVEKFKEEQGGRDLRQTFKNFRVVGGEVELELTRKGAKRIIEEEKEKEKQERMEEERELAEPDE